MKATARSIGPWRAAAASLAALVLLGGTVSCGSGSLAGGRPEGGEPDAGRDQTPDAPSPVDAIAGSDGEADVVEVDGGTCGVLVESHPDEGATHIACTSPAVYDTDPPSSGNHFDTWAAYRTYDWPVPWGNLVHCLEHGAMVVSYNCPDGCPDEVTRAQLWIDALPPDPACASQRIVLTPEPTLGVRWAASAWTWTLRADCFDEGAFGQFYADHYGHGREAVCGGGASTPTSLCAAPSP